MRSTSATGFVRYMVQHLTRLTVHTILGQYSLIILVLDNPQCRALSRRWHADNAHQSNETPQESSYQVAGAQEWFPAMNERVRGGIFETSDHL
jgi:hypothetical protein